MLRMHDRMQGLGVGLYLNTRTYNHISLDSTVHYSLGYVFFTIDNSSITIALN